MAVDVRRIVDFKKYAGLSGGPENDQNSDSLNTKDAQEVREKQSSVS
jgi:hypothetical protein